MPEALAAVFPATTLQTCIVHLIRNSLDYASWKYRKLLAAAIKQAGGTDGRKVKDALENLTEKVEGVVTIYDRPFTAADHEAITANIPVFGVVRGGRVVPMYDEDVAGEKAVRIKARV